MHAYLHTLHHHPAGNSQLCNCTQKNHLCWCRFGCNKSDLSGIRRHLQSDHFTEAINISNPMFMTYTYTQTNRRECMHTYVPVHVTAFKLAMNAHKHTQTLNHTCGPARVHVLTCTHHTISLQGIASHTTALKSAKCVNAGLAAIVFTSLTFINIYKENSRQRMSQFLLSIE